MVSGTALCPYRVVSSNRKHRVTSGSRSGGIPDGLVSLILQARVRCQQNEAALAAIRPRQALAWACTAVRALTHAPDQ